MTLTSRNTTAQHAYTSSKQQKIDDDDNNNNYYNYNYNSIE